MANTYTQIYIQIVFAVNGRESLIKQEWKEELYKYISGIIKNHKQKLLAINGVEDHVHILIGFGTDMKLSDLVGEIKTSSNKFVNSKRFVRGNFSWQEGFGAFSYSRSQLDNVIRYIENQEMHHAKKSFKHEYTSLLRKFDVEFNEEYLFNWVD